MKNNEYMTTAMKNNTIRSTLYNYTLSDPKIAEPKTTVLPIIDKKYIYIGVAAIIGNTVGLGITAIFGSDKV